MIKYIRIYIYIYIYIYPTYISPVYLKLKIVLILLSIWNTYLTSTIRKTRGTNQPSKENIVIRGTALIMIDIDLSQLCMIIIMKPPLMLQERSHQTFPVDYTNINQDNDN